MLSQTALPSDAAHFGKMASNLFHCIPFLILTRSSRDKQTAQSDPRGAPIILPSSTMFQQIRWVLMLALVLSIDAPTQQATILVGFTQTHKAEFDDDWNHMPNGIAAK